MVTLSRIYTRTGDTGSTRLGDLSLVPKHDPRVEAYGAVDELNAVIGVALVHGLSSADVELLHRIQNELFDLGADLCRPYSPDEAADAALRVTAAQVRRLEAQIDAANSGLPVLRSFILPGGTPAAAWLHMARTVCRRAERRVWALGTQAELNPQAPIYLNRLSDLLFVLARAANEPAGDILWEPGGTRERDEPQG